MSTMARESPWKIQTDKILDVGVDMTVLQAAMCCHLSRELLVTFDYGIRH